MRPLSMAKRVPRDYVIMGWPVGAGSPTGTCSGEANSPIAGVRSPPLRGKTTPYGWPSGEDLGPRRKAVFSEGRTLCARIARHHEWQGLSLPPVVRREVGGLMGKREEVARRSWRACGARPSAGSLPKEDCLKG